MKAKKSYKVKPTEKQRRAFNKIIDGVGKKRRKVPIGTAMVEAGYSPATAIHPQNLTQSKGFEILLEQAGGITDEKLAEKGKELLKAQKLVSVGGRVGKGPDYAIQIKAWEIFLKMRGYLKDKLEHSGAVDLGLDVMMKNFLDRLEKRADEKRGRVGYSVTGNRDKA